jgi:hypothetical protein
MYRTVHDLGRSHDMARQRIEHHATTSADPATVYALLRDGASWPAWSSLETFALERPGADEPEGLGAVRRFTSGRVTGPRPGRRAHPGAPLLLHAHLEHPGEGLPRGRRPRADRRRGTAIRWVSAFDPKVPGTGWLLRRGLDSFVAGLANGLAAHAAKVAAGRRASA